MKAELWIRMQKRHLGLAGTVVSDSFGRMLQRWSLQAFPFDRHCLPLRLGIRYFGGWDLHTGPPPWMPLVHKRHTQEPWRNALGEKGDRPWLNAPEVVPMNVHLAPSVVVFKIYPPWVVHLDDVGRGRPSLELCQDAQPRQRRHHIRCSLLELLGL